MPENEQKKKKKKRERNKKKWQWLWWCAATTLEKHISADCFSSINYSCFSPGEDEGEKIDNLESEFSHKTLISFRLRRGKFHRNTETHHSKMRASENRWRATLKCALGLSPVEDTWARAIPEQIAEVLETGFRFSPFPVFENCLNNLCKCMQPLLSCEDFRVFAAGFVQFWDTHEKCTKEV